MPVASELKRKKDKLSVLVMEDDDQERRETCKLIRRYGCTALEAASGAEALKLSPRSDVIWADIGLPDQKGNDVVKEILKRDASKRIIFITGISEYNDPLFKEKLKLDGITYDMFIRKPIVDFNPIYDLFAQIVAGREELRQYLINIKEALLQVKTSDTAEIDKHEAFLTVKELISGLWDQLQNSQTWKKRLAIQLRLSLSKWSIVPSESLGLGRPNSAQLDAFIAIVDKISLSNLTLTDELAVEKWLSETGIETRLEIPQLEDILGDS